MCAEARESRRGWGAGGEHPGFIPTLLKGLEAAPKSSSCFSLPSAFLYCLDVFP